MTELLLDYVPNESFSLPDAEQVLLAPMPEAEVAAKKTPPPGRLTPFLAALYDVPLLTREQEQHLFRRFNYLKYKARKLRETCDSTRPESVADEIEGLQEQALTAKNRIIRANLRLVVSIAKRYARPLENLLELVSDGNMTLMRAVEKFDFSRGNKFSTYASWAIIKNFSRTIPNGHKRLSRFRTSFDQAFFNIEDSRSNPYECENRQLQRQAQVSKILGSLDEREHTIIARRFGLGEGQTPRTLKQVGAELGLTKERIRQLQVRALHKLRRAARAEHIEEPELH